MNGTTATPAALDRPEQRPSNWVEISRRSLRYRQMQIGLVLVGVIVVLAFLGPLFAPNSATEIVGPPFAAPSASAPLGTDVIGRDVLSRVLDGGHTVVELSLAATALGVLLGLVVGLIAGYSESALDDLVMGANDVILAFPQIVLVLLLVSVIGVKIWIIVLAVALTHSSRVARLTRSVTKELKEREFVESAQLIGLPRHRVMIQEILPNLATPLLVEFGLRLTWSIGLIAGISFLGYGIQAPQADWGLMINENRTGLTIQEWSVVAPILCIFVFTIGTNLMSDGAARSIARVERGGDRR